MKRIPYEAYRKLGEEFSESDCYGEFITDSINAGIMNESGDPTCLDFHLRYCEELMSFIDWADPDTLRNRPHLTEYCRAEAERLYLWWAVQGERMLSGQHYLTEV